MYSYFKTGEISAEGSSITEGIGQSRITKNIEGAPIDDAYQIPDEEAVPVVFELLKEEGLCLGGSSGINVAGAIRLARDLGPGHTIVHPALRQRHAVPVEALQPRLPRGEGPPGPGLALSGPERGANRRARRSIPG